MDGFKEDSWSGTNEVCGTCGSQIEGEKELPGIIFEMDSVICLECLLKEFNITKEKLLEELAEIQID